MKDSFENILKSSKKKPRLVESDQGSHFACKVFRDLWNKNSFKKYSRYTSLRAVFADRFNHTVRDLLSKKPFVKELMPIGSIYYLQ